MHVSVVAREAARLDRINPGWHRRINQDHLDMGSDRFCVLGQIYVHAWDAPQAQKFRTMRAYMPIITPFSTLRWQRQINRRLDTDAARTRLTFPTVRTEKAKVEHPVHA